MGPIVISLEVTSPTVVSQIITIPNVIGKIVTGLLLTSPLVTI